VSKIGGSTDVQIWVQPPRDEAAMLIHLVREHTGGDVKPM
jgi:hypothetical protein